MTIEATPVVLRAAKRLEADIREKGLRSGERYISTRDAGNMLGVSLVTANRAMQLLEQKGILVRRHSSGTYVGPKAEAPALKAIQAVQVFVPAQLVHVASLPLELMLRVLERQMEGQAIQCHVFPANESLEYIRQTLGRGLEDGSLAGALVVSGTRGIYKYIIENGFPAVVLGTPDPDLDSIPFLDADYRQAGRILVERLAARGHRRFGVIVGAEGRPGTHQFYDGVMEAITQAALPPSAVTLRFETGDLDAVRAHLQSLLETPDRPTALVAQGYPPARLAASAACDLGISVPDALEIGCFVFVSPEGEKRPFLHARPQLPFEQIVGKLAGFLKQAAKREALENQKFLLPVELSE